MAENLKILKERLSLEKQIKEAKAKAAAEGDKFSDAEIKSLREKEARVRAIKKIEAAANKERDEASSKLFGLQSKVNQLQNDFVKIVKVGNVELLRTGKAFQSISSLIPSDTMKVFAGDIADVTGAVKNLETQLDELDKGDSPLQDKLQRELDNIEKQGFTAQSGTDFGMEQSIIDRAERFAEILPAIDTELKGLTNEGVRFTSGVTEQMVDTIDMTGKLNKSLDALGTDSFTSLVNETKMANKAGERFLANMEKEVDGNQDLVDSLKSKLKVLEDIGIQTVEEQELYDDLKEKIDNTTNSIDKAKASMEEYRQKQKENVEEAERLEATNRKIKNSVEYISKPFDALLSAMEKLPGGKLIADFTGMREAVDGFKEGASDIFKTLASDMVKAQSLPKGEQGAAQMAAMSKAMQGLQTTAKAAFVAIANGFKMAIKMSYRFLIALAKNPILLLVVAAVALGLAMRKAVKYGEEMRKQTGATREEALGMQIAINQTAINFAYLGVKSEQVKEIAEGIMESMGGMRNVTQENLQSMAKLTAEFGMAPGKIAPAVTMLKAMGASSNEMATSQLEQIGNMARLEGVSPAAIFEDMTADMETFAKFGKDGGVNLAKASITARKLGVNMAAIASSAESLLDFESSIQSQMEAVMLTGRSINTDEARRLALAGDMEGQAREIAKQVGTQAQFDAMNVVQREAMAKAFGIQVSDLAKMVANQEELKNMTLAERLERQEMEKRNKQLNKGMADLGKELGSLFKEVMVPIQEILIALGPTLGLILKAIAVSFKVAFLPLKFTLSLINYIIRAFGVLNNYVQSGLDFLDGWGESIDSWRESLPSVGENIQMIINLGIAGFNYLGGVWNSTVESIINGWNNVIQRIKTTWSSLVTGIGNMWNTYVTIPITRLGLWWDYTVIKMRQGFKDFSDYVVQGVINIGNRIISPFVKLVDVIKSLGEKIKNVVMNPIASLKSLLKGILPNWALKLLGMGGSDATKEVMGEMQGPMTRDEAFKKEFRKQRDLQGRGGQFEFGDEMFSTNYKEEGYDLQPRSAPATPPTTQQAVQPSMEYRPTNPMTGEPLKPGTRYTEFRTPGMTDEEAANITNELKSIGASIRQGNQDRLVGNAGIKRSQDKFVTAVNQG